MGLPGRDVNLPRNAYVQEVSHGTGCRNRTHHGWFWRPASSQKILHLSPQETTPETMLVTTCYLCLDKSYDERSLVISWYLRLGSNQRSPVYQTGALPLSYVSMVETERFELSNACLQSKCCPIEPRSHWCSGLVTIQLPSAFQTDALPFELPEHWISF